MAREILTARCSQRLMASRDRRAGISRSGLDRRRPAALPTVGDGREIRDTGSCRENEENADRRRQKHDRRARQWGAAVQNDLAQGAIVAAFVRRMLGWMRLRSACAGLRRERPRTRVDVSLRDVILHADDE